LPRIRAIAPEWYADLTAHTSWTRLLFRFLFDPEISLYSRMTREHVAVRGLDHASLAAPTSVETRV
jgi:hypothetical protein